MVVTENLNVFVREIDFGKWRDRDGGESAGFGGSSQRCRAAKDCVGNGRRSEDRGEAEVEGTRGEEARKISIEVKDEIAEGAGSEERGLADSVEVCVEEGEERKYRGVRGG